LACGRAEEPRRGEIGRVAQAAVGPIPSPTSFMVNFVSGNEVALSWTVASNVDSVVLARAPSGVNSWMTVVSGPGNLTTFDDGGVQPNTIYTYRLTLSNQLT